MPDDINDTPAAANLAAAIAEFETPAAPDGSPPADANDLFASFGEPATEDKPAETTPPVEDKPDATPAATEDEPPPADGADPYPTEIPGASKKANEHFRAIKANLKNVEREKAALAEEVAKRDAELEDLRKKVVELPELSERAKAAEEAERELAISRVEGTREFKDTIIKPLEAIEAAAGAIAKANDVDLDAILDVLTERDPAKQRDALEELISGLKTVDQLKVVRMAEDTQQLLAKRDEIKARAVEARKELEEITSRKETEARKKARDAFESAVSHTITELKKRIPFVPLADGETADAVFDVLQGSAVKADLDAASPDIKAFAATASVLLPRVTRQLVQAQAQIKKLEARVAESNSVRPTSATPVQTAPPSDGDDLLDVTATLLGLQKSKSILQTLE